MSTYYCAAKADSLLIGADGVSPLLRRVLLSAFSDGIVVAYVQLMVRSGKRSPGRVFRVK